VLKIWNQEIAKTILQTITTTSKGNELTKRNTGESNKKYWDNH
jgi:hypothetical protein